MGAVSPVPVVVTGADLVNGTAMTSESIEEVASKAQVAVNPIDDLRGTVAYKRHLVEVLVRRALTACVNEEEIR